MLVVSRFVLEADSEGFQEKAKTALAAFAERPGFLRGRVGRATDDPRAWVLVTEWAGVGDYRRSLSSYDVRVSATPLLALAVPEPGAYEVLLATDASASPAPPVERRSGRAADAGQVRVGEASAPSVPVEGQP